MSDWLPPGQNPYFSRNRDVSDAGYEDGWNDARAGRKPNPRSQKETYVKAYFQGYNSATGTTE